MPTPPFAFQKLFETGPDETEYRRLTQEYVSTAEFAGKEMLVVEPEALSLLANQAFQTSTFSSDRPICSRLPPFLTIPKPPRTTAWSR
ncbi:MAG: hypothetical protein R3F31_09560 [Verrucomicrobiales bacterium]